MFLAFYAGISIVLWLASAVAPIWFGPVSAYTVEISITIALTFGGMYALASILRPSRRDGISAPR